MAVVLADGAPPRRPRPTGWVVGPRPPVYRRSPSKVRGLPSRSGSRSRSGSWTCSTVSSRWNWPAPPAPGLRRGSTRRRRGAGSPATSGRGEPHAAGGPAPVRRRQAVGQPVPEHCVDRAREPAPRGPARHLEVAGQCAAVPRCGRTGAPAADAEGRPVHPPDRPCSPDGPRATHGGRRRGVTVSEGRTPADERDATTRRSSRPDT